MSFDSVRSIFTFKNIFAVMGIGAIAWIVGALIPNQQLVGIGQAIFGTAVALCILIVIASIATRRNLLS